MKIKVCGMKDTANIAEVSALEPDYMSFIFYGGLLCFDVKTVSIALASVSEEVV